jgi:PAS domain S-box-containing protein
MDHRIIFGDGTKGFITVSSYIEKDVNGRTVKTYGVNQDITERKQVEEELMKNEALMRTAVENLPLIFYVIDRDGKFKLSIGAGLKRLGLKPNQVVDQSAFEVYNEYPEIIVSINKSLEGESVTFDSNISGASFVNFLTPMNVLKGTSEGIVGVAMDVTEQKILQKELLQAQKMESVGTLAGGIAHDFNNILGIILAYSSMLERVSGDEKKISEYSGVIGQAVNRGAGLVRQILTFARKTDVALAPMSFIDLLHELISMLKQTFPKVITFIEIVDNELPVINADRTQIHQVLMNLCVNARDAMPSGGVITIKAEKQTKDQVREKITAANQDSYICITVTDTGTGMNEETRRRIFDPFYTTKEQGKGTGLGLAVVYGVVQSHHGFIDVESEVGHGTTFRLYFPIPLTNEQLTDLPLAIESYSTGGTETILVVEDEEALIEMVLLLLESKGYHVFTARDGKEAVEIFRQHKQEIDIVLTDMGLPGMTGVDEFKMLKEIAPDVKVVFASGFFDPVIKSDLYIGGAKGFIQKPYSPDEILRKIREVLDTKG